MVLPELSRTMAYRTHKTVSRLERKQVYLNCGARTSTGGINLYIEQEEHKLDQIAARNFRASVIRIYLLYLQTVIIAAGPGAQYRMQVSNMFTVNFYVLSLESKFVEI